ncbi:GHKL domain-containing protein, partial [candidate division KSB1 bacterium]|nr:GHKL domain-containing protein [candidate division KSB1 bacterium]
VLYRNIRKEMELARMKADFVSNVSHELRTPLALIRMFAETIEMDRISSDDEKKEYCKIIAHESERLTHIINNILDFSKMDAGKKEYHFQQVDLNKVVAEILKMYKYHLDSKGFTLEENINPQKLLINADRGAISEVLVNLLDNAVKYSDVRKQITIATGSENQHVFLEIVDSGIGISAKDQKRIYQKFYRVAGDHKKPVKGSGLGLTLVRHIMDAHGGRIVLKSKPGEGSRFRLIFNKASEEHTS